MNTSHAIIARCRDTIKLYSSCRNIGLSYNSGSFLVKGIRMRLPPGYVAPPNYTPPMPQGGVWRMDPHVVVRKGAVLPAACIKCGAPPAGRPYRRRLSWHDPVLYVLILAGLLVYVIVALIVRKTGTVDVCLCARHRSNRNKRTLAAWLALVGGIGLFVGGCVLEAVAPMLLGVAMLFASPIPAAINSRMVVSTRIDDYYITLSGVEPNYLALLPWADGRDAAPPAERPAPPIVYAIPAPPPLPPRR